MHEYSPSYSGHFRAVIPHPRPISPLRTGWGRPGGDGLAGVGTATSVRLSTYGHVREDGHILTRSVTIRDPFCAARAPCDTAGPLCLPDRGPQHYQPRYQTGRGRLSNSVSFNFTSLVTRLYPYQAPGSHDVWREEARGGGPSHVAVAAPPAAQVSTRRRPRHRPGQVESARAQSSGAR